MPVSDGTSVTSEVIFRGGFIDAENGVYNSEAPSGDDVKIGSDVVVFYKWNANLGGGVGGNELYAAHGGLFRTVTGPTTDVVLGRGEGYAIQTNTEVNDLNSAVRKIRRIKKQPR